MALELETLAKNIKKAFDDQSNKNIEEIGSPERAREKMAEDIAAAIHNYILGGEVTTDVTGSCNNAAGAGTILGNGVGQIR